jgi:hypothetical protein
MPRANATCRTQVFLLGWRATGLNPLTKWNGALMPNFLILVVALVVLALVLRCFL